MDNLESRRSAYAKIFGALLLLLGVTVAAYFVDLGPFNVLVALTIAFVKAILVVLFFMHVKDSGHLIWIYSGMGLIWILISITLTLSDYLTRLPFALPTH